MCVFFFSSEVVTEPHCGRVNTRECKFVLQHGGATTGTKKKKKEENVSREVVAEVGVIAIDECVCVRLQEENETCIRVLL